MDISLIPDPLATRRQWVLWRYEERDGRRTKVLLQPDYHKGERKYAKANEPKTWRSIAIADLVGTADDIDGIGFVFSPDDEFFGLDLDDCIDAAGNLSEFAAGILAECVTYTEISPSGRGLKMIGRGTIPEEFLAGKGTGRRDSKLGLEVYHSGRFFTFTGRIYEGRSQLGDCQSAVDAIVARHFDRKPKRERKKITTPVADADLTDEQIVKKASESRSGEVFRQLWSGQWEGRYGSQSEADQALTNMLAFYCRDDAGRLDSLFRQSGLMRDKWADRDDYRSETISRALAVAGEGWKSPDDRALETQSAIQTAVDSGQVDEMPGIEFEELMCQHLGIDVLGYVLDRDRALAKVWSKHHGKTELINPDKLSYPACLRLIGPLAKARIADKDAIGDQYTVAQLRKAIALLSGFRRADEDAEVGPGCWQSIDDSGEEQHSVVLVGAGSSVVLNGRPELIRLTSPRHGGRILDTSSEAAWYDADELDGLVQSWSHESAAETIEATAAYFSGWKWGNQTVDPYTVTGLVLSTWVQTLWEWRPQIAICGESKAGKSFLFKSLQHLFGPLCSLSSQSTAAGLRQGLSHSAVIPLCDEFDSTSEKQKIREMIRAASRGDVVLRGTGNQRGTSFTLRHIFWLAGISVEMRRAPDRNRFILLELLRPAKEDRGKLQMISEADGWNLGQRLLATAIKSIMPARELAAVLRQVRVEGVDDRLIECYSVPASMLAAAQGLPQGQAETLLRQMVADVAAEDEVMDDGSELLGDILSARISIGKGEHLTVSQILLDEHADLQHCEALEQFGIASVYESRARRDEMRGTDISSKFLFINPKVVAATLLRSSETWIGQDIGQILRRIDGAYSDRRRIAKRLVRGVTIPWRAVGDTGTDGTEDRF